MNASIAQETSVAAPARGDDAEAREMLRASAADFVAGTRDHKRTRALRNTLPGYDEGVVRQMAALGWHGILVPEASGGSGLGFAEMAVVLEELGKGLMGEPLVASVVLAGRALQHGDNPLLKDRLLPRLARGELVPCLAWQEEGGGLEVAAVAAKAEDAEGGVRITGRKRYVAAAGAAEGFLVTARHARGVGLYWVERDAPGLQIHHEWRADGTPSAVVELEAVAVATPNVAAAPGRALAAVSRALDEAMVMASAEMCGVLRATLAMTLDYMRVRVQFGKPIGSFQALQHRVVDLYIQQELAGAVLREAVQALDAEVETPQRVQLVSRAKARASEAGLRITREAVQLHGAIAIQDECDVGLYLKRALVLSAWLGNAGQQRRRFSAEHAETVRAER